MVYGLWSMVYGLWFMVYGLWSKIFLKSGVAVAVFGIFHFCPRLAQTGIKGDLNGLSKVVSTLSR